MEKVEIKPLESFNNISFGTRREMLWETLGNPKNSFKKTESSITETDNYGAFHVYYDENYSFEAVDVFNDVDIYYNGDLLPKKYSLLLQYFKDHYKDIEEDEYGFISKECSVGVYVENDEDLVDVITFGKKDYYDY